MNNGGITMEVVKARLNADLLAPIINIPTSLLGKDVEVTITEPDDDIIDELYGIAANVNMSLDEIRGERLNKK